MLRSRASEFAGIDHQVDTYFRCDNGRLKLREGNIERALIFYERSDEPGPRASHVQLVEVGPDSERLRELLTAALGARVVVDKRREIYFADNVKLHLDEVARLGVFVEIEARDLDGRIGEARLREQCAEWLAILGVTEDDLVDGSYSDLLLEEAD